MRTFKLEANIDTTCASGRLRLRSCLLLALPALIYSSHQIGHVGSSFDVIVNSINTLWTFRQEIFFLIVITLLTGKLVRPIFTKYAELEVVTEQLHENH